MSNFTKNHFANLEQLLKAQSSLCQSDLPNYDIGLNREFFIKEVLKTHLPTYCEITSGCVCDHKHKPSGQVDIILFHPLSLRINIGVSDCCLSESSFSVIEVKSRLNEDHFRTSVHNLAAIAALSREHLYSEIKGATWSSEAYHFDTIGTVLFGYSGYKPTACIEAVKSVLKDNWQKRPEVVYCLDKG